MSIESIAGPVETEGDGVVIDGDEQRGNLEHDAGLERGSEPEAQQPPPRKRPRDTKTVIQAVSRKEQIRGKQGSLAGLMNMPVDIFTEISSYLLPIDIIFLARSNRFFRNMLMDRSSLHIWHGSMENMPDFVPFSPDMNEPHIFVLVFLKTCWKCGNPAKGRMDGAHRVRLCESCRVEQRVTRPSKFSH